MSEEVSEELTLAAGNREIQHCPFCGEKFTPLQILNKKMTCPVEGGCGISFIVYKK